MQSSQIKLDRRWLLSGAGLVLMLLLLGAVVASFRNNNSGAEKKSLPSEDLSQRSSQISSIPWSEGMSLNKSVGFAHDTSNFGNYDELPQTKISVVAPTTDSFQSALIPLRELELGDTCSLVQKKFGAEHLSDPLAIVPTEYNGRLHPIAFEAQPLIWAEVRSLQGRTAFEGLAPQNSLLGVEIGGEIFIIPPEWWGANYECQ
jgi:hypothetical protein